jgi:hypothetical protein
LASCDLNQHLRVLCDVVKAYLPMAVSRAVTVSCADKDRENAGRKESGVSSCTSAFRHLDILVLVANQGTKITCIGCAFNAKSKKSKWFSQTLSQGQGLEYTIPALQHGSQFSALQKSWS